MHPNKRILTRPLLERIATPLALLAILSLTWPVLPGRAAGHVGTPAAQSDAHDVVLLVREPQHLSAALKTAEEIRSDATVRAGRIEIIVCGKASSSLQVGSNLEDALREAAGRGAVITACGMSLNQMNIDPATLLDIVQVVPNGLTRALQLQAEGYLSVEL